MHGSDECIARIIYNHDALYACAWQGYDTVICVSALGPVRPGTTTTEPQTDTLRDITSLLGYNQHCYL